MPYDEDRDFNSVASSCTKHPHEQQRLGHGKWRNRIPGSKEDNVRGAGEYSIVMELNANEGKEGQA